MYPILVFLVFVAVTLFPPTSGNCDNKHAQILVLVDKSGWGNNNPFPKIGKALGTHFPNSEFTVASYTRTNCFHIVLRFTTNSTEVANVHLQAIDPTPIASALKAIEFASHKLLWSSDKQALKLVLLFITQNVGGDTGCGGVPTASSVANQLKQQHIKLIVFREDRVDDSTLNDFMTRLTDKNVQLHQIPFALDYLDSVGGAVATLAEAHCEVMAPSTSPAGTCDSVTTTIPRLQVAFVQDRTQSFHNFSVQFAKLSKGLIVRLQDEFPNSEFALATFADYPSTQIKGGSDQHKENEFGCFKIYSRLTTDAAEFANSAAKVTTLDGGPDYPENALAAILFTIADTKLGWTDKSMDESGRPIKKIVILLTNENTKTVAHNRFFKNPEDRRNPLGDGSDNCVNSFIPEFRFVGNMLRRGSFIPLAFVDKTIMSKWKTHFNQNMQVKNAHFADLDLSNTTQLVTSIEEFVKIMVHCIWEMDPPGMNTYGL